MSHLPEQRPLSCSTGILIINRATEPLALPTIRPGHRLLHLLMTVPALLVGTTPSAHMGSQDLSHLNRADSTKHWARGGSVQ